MFDSLQSGIDSNMNYNNKSNNNNDNNIISINILQKSSFINKENENEVINKNERPCKLEKKKLTKYINNCYLDLHRASCHRCGNLRKYKQLCKKCPYVYCFRCVKKMIEEHGEDVFVDGCPVVS